MSYSCPNENNPEWIKILEDNNDNREAALVEWGRLLAREEAKEEADRIKNLEEEFDEDEVEEILTPEEQEHKDLQYKKVSEKMHEHLEKELDLIKNKKVINQRSKENKLKLLIQNINALNGVDAINAFIVDSHTKALAVQKRLGMLLANKSNMSSKEYIAALTDINEFVTGYSILDEITDLDIANYFSKPVNPNKKLKELTPQEMLTEAISIKNKVQSKFLSEGVPLMADFLLEYKPENMVASVAEQVEFFDNRIKIIQDTPTTSRFTDEYKEKRINELEEKKANWQNFTVDKKSLVELLTSTTKDESLMSFLFDPLVSNADAGLSLFAISVKSEIETARQKDIVIRRELADVFDEYAATVGSKDSTAEFNKGLYEFTEVPVYDKDGTPTGEFKQQVSFIKKYDQKAFRLAQSEMYRSLDKTVGPRSNKPIEQQSIAEKKITAARKKAAAKWYDENRQVKSQKEIDQIWEDKKQDLEDKLITPDEYKNWYNENIYSETEDGKIIYMGSGVFMEPSNKYISSNWSALYDVNDNPINVKGRYHQKLWQIYQNAQDLLPSRREDANYLLPSIEKTTKERAQDNGIKDAASNAVSDAFNYKTYDTQYGSSKKIIPVYFTQPMDAKDVSLDLAKTVLLFSAMANRYDALNKIHGETALFKAIIGKKEFAETSSKGEAIIDKFSKKLGYDNYLTKTVSNSQKHLDAFIDMIINGEMQAKEEIAGFAIDKIVNSGLNYSAITTIAADLLKGVANNLQGNIQLIIEAASGEFFTKKNLGIGKAYYAKSVVSFLSDFGKSAPESLVGKLVEKYDPLQGNFKDTYGNAISATVARKLIRTDTLFFNQSFGEHEIQISAMFALMKAVKVKDNNTGEEIDLLQAHELYGADDVQENTDFTEKNRQEFQNRLHALNKRLNGVYNDFDKGTAQRYSLGRLGLMYRKHLIPGFKRRYKRASMDMELGSVTEGFYRTFWDTFVRDLRDYKLNVIQNWSTYTPFQKAQAKKVAMEASIIASLWGLVTLLLILGEDDEELKKSYMYNFMLYEMSRMKSETASYAPVVGWSDLYRTVKSPTAMVTTFERVTKFANQFIFTWDPDKLSYKRKEGVWNKGDNKSWAYFLKLMGYSGYNFKPEAAVKSFNSTLVK